MVNTKFNQMIILILVLVFSCERDTNPLKAIPQPSMSDLNKIILQQIDYDSLLVKNAEELKLEDKSVHRIIFGEKTSTAFVIKETILPRYSNVDGKFQLNFEFRTAVAPTVLKYKFTIRFELENSAFIDVDTIHTMINYPYESSRIFYLWDDFLKPSIPDIQDFDVTDSNLFYHPYGPLGLYEYNFPSGINVSLMLYVGGDYISADSIFVTADVEHDAINRFNLQADSVDLMVDLTAYVNYIMGVEIYKEHIYVLSDNNELLKFDLDGNLIETIPYQKWTYSLAIHNDIVYSLEGAEISRFDLATESFLEGKKVPSGDTETIKIHNNRLYFSDYDRRYIGVMQLSDIQ